MTSENHRRLDYGTTIRPLTSAGPACFELLTVFGSIVSWSMLAKTDSGYITQTEIADTARRIIQSVSVPVIVGCDDGFGDPINVRRTLQIMEHMGAAGMYIEDLSRPLRCSGMGDGRLIASDAMVQKIRGCRCAQGPRFLHDGEDGQLRGSGRTHRPLQEVYRGRSGHGPRHRPYH